MTASVNHMPVTETWDRMEKASLAEITGASSSSSSQPDFIPLSTPGAESARNYSTEEHQDSLNGYQQPSLPSQAKRKRLISGENTTTDTPWRTSKEYTCDPAGLHEEICDFYEYLKPRPSEIKMREDVIERMRVLIRNRWPQAEVHVFGSFCTNLFLPTGDIDLVVYGRWPTIPLFSLEEDLKSNEVAVEDSILVLDKTVVPIIKFIDRLTEVRVDISFNQGSGLKSAQQIQQFILEYPFLPKLVFVLKQFLYQRNLHEVYYGGISSYSLILLLVSFLQLHPRYMATSSNPNLGVLLIEFFELYGRHFNYMKTGITVLDGGSYFPKDEKIKLMESGKNCLLYVVDPSKPDDNAASGCFGLWQVKQAFEYAFSCLHSLVLSRENPTPKLESLLSDIVKVSKEVMEYRNWVDSIWSNPALSPAPPPPSYYFPVLHPGPGLILPHPPMAGPAPYLPIPPQPQAYIQHSNEPSPGKHLNHSFTSNSNSPRHSSSHEKPSSKKIAVTS